MPQEYILVQDNMAAPTALKVKLAEFIDAAWDAHVAGTLGDHDWNHDAVEMSFGGRRVILQISLTHRGVNPYIVITIKRLPA
jgi:hypothetical protein